MIKKELVFVLNLAKDFIAGRYKGISKKSMIMVIAALIYLVNPMDIVPDMVLGIGLLDDISVFTYLMTKIKSEIDKYEEWALNNQH